MTRYEAAEILGVRQEADAEAIRTAYRAAALRCHPDRGGDDRLFRKVIEAYSILRTTPPPIPSSDTVPPPTAPRNQGMPDWLEGLLEHAADPANLDQMEALIGTRATAVQAFIKAFMAPSKARKAYRKRGKK